MRLGNLGLSFDQLRQGSDRRGSLTFADVEIGQEQDSLNEVRVGGEGLIEARRGFGGVAHEAVGACQLKLNLGRMSVNGDGAEARKRSQCVGGVPLNQSEVAA